MSAELVTVEDKHGMTLFAEMKADNTLVLSVMDGADEPHVYAVRFAGDSNGVTDALKVADAIRAWADHVKQVEEKSPMRYVRKPEVVEAVTFAELVAHGIAQCRERNIPLNGGMPWSFQYVGRRVTHENDDCYLVPTSGASLRMERGDVLVTRANGELEVCSEEEFAALHTLWTDGARRPLC